jgi:GAF domain-containing protein
VSAEEVTEALERLAMVIQDRRTLGAALAGIAEAAVLSVPGCDAASIALSIEGRPATAAATARVALELDLVQYDSAEGPCLTTFHTIEAVRLDIVESGETFPHFSRAARDRGILGVLSVPSTWGSEVVATLNLYSRRGPFDGTAVSVARVLAAQAAIAVSRSPEYALARATVEQAQRDLDDRADIDVASGLLMATQGCTSEQAEGLLRQAADQEAQTILQIAHRILDQHNNTR